MEIKNIHMTISQSSIHLHAEKRSNPSDIDQSIHCRSQNMLDSTIWLQKIGVDAAESEAFKMLVTTHVKTIIDHSQPKSSRIY